MGSGGPNLLDEALELDSSTPSGGRVVLVEDCAETSGAFVLHHVLKRSLQRGGVVFLALAHPFPHYDRILRKIGCNLSAQIEAGRLDFIDMLELEIKDSCDVGSTTEIRPIQLFEKIQTAVCRARCTMTTIVIDDIFLLEIAAQGSTGHVLDILHHCATLTSEMNGSLVALNHADAYEDKDFSKPMSCLKYHADIMIKIKPLITGLAADVHGQLIVINGKARNRHMVHNFHFKVKENGAEFFYPGKFH